MRWFTPVRFAALLSCGMAVTPLWTSAQEGRARVTTNDAVPTARPAAQEPRPMGEALHRPAEDPALNVVLNDWFDKTRGIQKLHGEHRRFTFESTFDVVKVSTGKFYFEAPDKGRIDLAPAEEKELADADPNTEGVQIRESGQQKNFTLKPDQPEQWVCDGTQIMRIDNAARTYEVTTIPEQHRGTNIMDGPLPFLFGMPPDKAKERYAMTLVSPPPRPDMIYLVVTPLLQKDAANWQRADVMLDAKTYLPTAVKLLDPSGNRITLFSFGSHKINPVNLLAIFGAGDPFKPSLFGLKQVQSQPPQAIQMAEGQPPKPLEGVPAVIGLSHTDAVTTLVARGFAKEQIKLVRDTSPSLPKLRWHVKQQSPAPNAAAQPGEPIVLTLYVTAEDLAKTAQAKP